MRFARPVKGITSLFVVVCFCWLIQLQAAPMLTVSGSETAASAPVKSDENAPGMIEQSGPPPKTKKSILPWILGGVAVLAIAGVLVLVVFKAKEKIAKQASISIRSVPDPIPYSYDSGGMHYWNFRHEVSEKAGVGAKLVEWYSDMYDINGSHISHQVFTMQDFESWFTDCGGVGVRIEANSTRCCDPFWYRSEGNAKGWRAEETMIFVDDLDNRITAVGKFTFMAIPGNVSSSFEVAIQKPRGKAGKFQK